MMKVKGEACEVVNVGDELLKLINNIVMRMAIGESCFNNDDEAHKLTERIKESSKVSGMVNLKDYFWFDLQEIGKNTIRKYTFNIGYLWHST